MNEMPAAQRVRSRIEARRASAGRTPRKYATMEEALARMKEENTHLNEEQAHHLTLHGAVASFTLNPSEGCR